MAESISDVERSLVREVSGGRVVMQGIVIGNWRVRLMMRGERSRGVCEKCLIRRVGNERSVQIVVGSI